MSKDSRKRQKLSEVCIIHFEELNEDNFTFLENVKEREDKIEHIREIAKKRLKEPIGSTRRFQNVCDQIPTIILESHGYHRDCYRKFSSHLERLIGEGETKSDTEKQPSGIECIFCGSAEKVHVSEGNARILQATTMFEQKGVATLITAAETKEDAAFLDKIRSVDLVAVGARYHPKCRKEYTRKAEAWRSSNSEQQAYQTELLEAHYAAFAEVCEHIKKEIVEGLRILKLGYFHEIYVLFLENTPFANPRYRAQKLKSKLMKSDYASKISFLNIPGKYDVVYSKMMTIEQAILLSHDLASSLNVTHFANEIKQDIQTDFYKRPNMIWPPTVDVLQDDLNKMPTKLNQFLNELFSSCRTKETYTFSIGQDICRAVTNGKWKLPKHILLCSTIRHFFRSKELITLLNKLGHWENYYFGLELETAIAETVAESNNQVSQSIVCNPIGNSVFISVFDNFDQFVNELSGSGSVHTAHGIMLQELEIDQANPPPSSSAQTRTKKRSLSIVPNENLPECYVNKKNGPNWNVQIRCHPDGPSSFQRSRKMNTLWSLLRHHNKAIPGWSGYISLTGEVPTRLTTIAYYPVIYNPITDNKTVQECLRVAAESSATVFNDATEYRK